MSLFESRKPPVWILLWNCPLSNWKSSKLHFILKCSSQLQLNSTENKWIWSLRISYCKLYSQKYSNVYIYHLSMSSIYNLSMCLSISSICHLSICHLSLYHLSIICLSIYPSVIHLPVMIQIEEQTSGASWCSVLLKWVSGS